MKKSSKQLSPQEALDLAMNFHRSGQLKEAEPIYKKLYQQNIAPDKISSLLGILYFDLDDLKSDKTYFENSISFENISEDVFNDYISALRKKNQTESAIEIANKGLERFPQSRNLKQVLQNIYLENKKHKESILMGGAINRTSTIRL